MQKILVMETNASGLRSEASGWTYENADFVKIDEHIGRSLGLGPNEPYPSYECPLKALADGWKLLAPPKRITGPDYRYFIYWWFTKD